MKEKHGMDSLEEVETIIDVELEFERFGLEIPSSEADKFKTARDHIDYVMKALGVGQTPGSSVEGGADGGPSSPGKGRGDG